MGSGGPGWWESRQQAANVVPAIALRLNPSLSPAPSQHLECQAQQQVCLCTRLVLNTFVPLEPGAALLQLMQLPLRRLRLGRQLSIQLLRRGGGAPMESSGGGPAVQASSSDAG